MFFPQVQKYISSHNGDDKIYTECQQQLKDE